MKMFSRVVAIGLVFLFVIALPLSILAYDVGRVVFDPVLVKQVVTDIATDSDLFTVGLQWYAERRAEQRYASGDAIAWQDEPDILDLLSLIELEDWLLIRSEVLTDEILTDWISASVDGTYAWLDSDEPVPEIIFNLSAFKDRVDSVHGLNAVRLVFSSLPTCTNEQIADFKSRLAAVPVGTEVPYNLCQFPDPWFDDQVSDYHQSINQIVQNIPPVFNLIEELTRDSQENGLERLKVRLLFARAMMRWAPLLPVVLLLLLSALAVRTLKSLGKWWGIPLAIGGTILLLVSLLYRSMITSALVTGPLQRVPSLLLQESIAAVMRLAEQVFRPMLWQSLIFLFSGIVLFVVGIFANPKVVDGKESSA